MASTPSKPLRFTLLSFGTRGDIQPFIALAKGLLARGHTVRLATNPRFKSWVEQHGVEFRSVGNDEIVLEIMEAFSTYGFIHPQVGKLMAQSRVENFYTYVWSKSLEAVDEGTDFILGNVFFICGQHIAESRKVPYLEVMPMVMFRTSSVPAVLAQNQVVKSDPSWFVKRANEITHDVFAGIWSVRFKWLINNFRTEYLNLKAVSQYDLYEYMSLRKQYEGICTFTPLLLDDIPPWIHAKGTWFLEDSEPSFEPSPKIQALLNAKSPRLIYLGFGSIRAKDPIKVIRDICKVIKDSEVCAVIAISGLVQDAPDLKTSASTLTIVNDRPVASSSYGTILESEVETTQAEFSDDEDIANKAGCLNPFQSCSPTCMFPCCIPKLSTEETERLLRESQLSMEERVDLEVAKYENELLPGKVVFVKSIPHDWIFPRVNVVVHHGGTGTMMAALKAGVPQVVKPFFGDQFIWGSLVERNEVGKTVSNGGGTHNIADGRLTKAIRHVLETKKYTEKAASMADKIKLEKGINDTIEFLEAHHEKFTKNASA